MNDDLQKLKIELDKAGFPEEVAIKLHSIIDNGIQNGSLSEEEEQEFDNLVNTAIAEAELEAEQFEEISDIFDDYIHKVNQQLNHLKTTEEIIKQTTNTEELQEQSPSNT